MRREGLPDPRPDFSWSRSLGDCYEHGVKIVGLSEEQKLFLFKTLSAMFRPEEVAQYSADERLAGS